MSYNEMIFLPQLDWVWVFRLGQGDSKRGENGPTVPTARTENCQFLTLLNSDTRFQIYDYLAPDRHTSQIIDIFEPNKDNSAKALDILMSTSHEIHDDVLLWLSQNSSWLTLRGPRGNVIQLLPTIQNTKYLLKWTSDFGCSHIPSKAVEAWHQFCFHNTTQSPIGPLVIEFHLPTRQDALSAFERLFAEPYRIEMGKRRVAVGPLPIAPFLTSIEIIICWWCLDETDARTRMPRRWNLDEKLRNAWAMTWHDVGGCSTVRKCGGLGTCRRRRRSRHPQLIWSIRNV
jgi:hypothetical protein